MMRVCAEKGTDFSLKKSVLFGQKVRTFSSKAVMSFIGKYSSFAESGAIFRRKRCCFYRETMCVLGGKVRGFLLFRYGKPTDRQLKV